MCIIEKYINYDDMKNEMELLGYSTFINFELPLDKHNNGVRTSSLLCIIENYLINKGLLGSRLCEMVIHSVLS